MTSRLRLPDQRGGWWHAYVCQVHGVELSHGDLLAGTFPAGGAVCPYGCRVDTEAVRGAWAALAHQACARAIRDLASTDPDRCLRSLTEYAQRYARLTASGEHQDAQAWMLRGRLFQQALSEAIWTVSICHAVLDLSERGVPVPDPVLGMLGDLAAVAHAARRKLASEGRFDSNYTAWLLAAEALATRAAGREPRPDWLDDLQRHVLEAVYADGWEWEASTYYHGFVLRAYLLGLRGIPLDRLDQDVHARLGAMASVLRAISTTGGIRPELHDGPYARPATEPEWDELAQLCRDFGLPDAPDPEPANGIQAFPNAGFVVVRAPGLHAILDAGPHGGSHGHRDKLALYLYGERASWQPDPGQVPYASPLRAHYASTEAHPGFMVDGCEQAECAGRIVRLDERSVTVECSDAYDGVHATRHLVRTEHSLLDVLEVHADRPRRITALLRPVDDFHAWREADGLLRTRWRDAGETLRGWHLASVPASFDVRPGLGLPDDPQRPRPRVDWTAEGNTVRFVSLYEAEGARTHAAVGETTGRTAFGAGEHPGGTVATPARAV